MKEWHSRTLKVSMMFSAGHDECLSYQNETKEQKGRRGYLPKENGFHKIDERMTPSSNRTLKEMPHEYQQLVHTEKFNDERTNLDIQIHETHQVSICEGI